MRNVPNKPTNAPFALIALVLVGVLIVKAWPLALFTVLMFIVYACCNNGKY